MILHRYNPEKPKKETVFYIQSHGLHAGRPLKNPIPNSWEMDTKTENAFEICFMVYNSKFLKNYLRGSVIPFLSLCEYRKIINPIFANPVQFEETTLKKLKTLQLLDVAIKKQEDTRKYYNELKIAIANELLKTFYHDKQNTYS
jgi:hypothetical protein